MTRFEPEWSSVTAVFGGTFDPPHLGHREAIRGLFFNPGVKRVRVIPAGDPPLKSAQAPAEDRLKMIRLLLDTLPEDDVRDRITLDDREVRGPRAGRTSYAAETLDELAREEGSIAFVIGTDQLAKLPLWQRFPGLLGLSHWIVMKRKPESEETLRQALRPLLESNLIRPSASVGTFEIQVPSRAGRPMTMKLVTTDALPLSSTGIRREIALQGSPPEGALTPEVDRYLKEKKLYGTQYAN